MSAETIARHVAATDALMFGRVMALSESTVTIAFDSGTVCRRWLAMVAHSAGQSFMVGMRNAKSFPDGALSGANINSYLRVIVATLDDNRRFVIACVADNAANMQCEDARIPGLVWVRCAAHLLALLVDDLRCTWFGEVEEAAEEIYKNAKEAGIKLPAACETRWNSHFRLIQAILKKSEPDQNPELVVPGELRLRFAESLYLLAPFNSASIFLQADNATVLDMATIFGSFFACTSEQTFFTDIISDIFANERRKAMILTINRSPR